MNDNLDTSMFKSINERTELERKQQLKLKLYKTRVDNKKMKLHKLRNTLLITGLSIFATAGLVGTIIHDQQHELVPHGRDYYSSADGRLVRIEDLNQTTWAADYKYVNEAADLEDAIEAYHEGEYFYYIEHNGEVKVDKELQATIDAKENDSVNYYNTTCVEFGNQVIDQLNLSPNNVELGTQK